MSLIIIGEVKYRKGVNVSLRYFDPGVKISWGQNIASHRCIRVCEAWLCIQRGTRAYIDEYIDEYIHPYIHTHMHTCIHTHIPTCLPTCLPTYIHAFIYACKMVLILMHWQQGSDIESKIIFWLHLYFLNILYFFKYSCINIFYRRGLCTFYFLTLLNAGFEPWSSDIAIINLLLAKLCDRGILWIFSKIFKQFFLLKPVPLF